MMTMFYESPDMLESWYVCIHSFLFASTIIRKCFSSKFYWVNSSQGEHLSMMVDANKNECNVDLI